MGLARAARDHGLIDGLNTTTVRVLADTAYQGGGAAVRVPQPRRRLDPDTGGYRRLSHTQKQVNAAPARLRGPGERGRRPTQILAHPPQNPQLPHPGNTTDQNRDRAHPDQLESKLEKAHCGALSPGPRRLPGRAPLRVQCGGWAGGGDAGGCPDCEPCWGPGWGPGCEPGAWPPPGAGKP